MNIIQNLELMVHRCKVVKQDKDRTDLANYMERIVIPRLKSYAIFLHLIDRLPNEHSLRGDPVIIEILEDERQLTTLAVRAQEYLE